MLRYVKKIEAQAQKMIFLLKKKTVKKKKTKTDLVSIA